MHTIVVYVSTLASVSLYLYGERRSPNQPSGTLRVVLSVSLVESWSQLSVRLPVALLYNSLLTATELLLPCWS